MNLDTRQSGGGNGEPRRRLRVFYAAGSGDVIGTYRHWCSGQDDPTQMHVTYSRQFFDVFRQAGASCYVISSNANAMAVRDAEMWVEHRPSRFKEGSGIRFHLSQILHGVQFAVDCARFRANLAVVAGGTHWFMLGLLRLLGVRVVPVLHCTLWRAGTKPTLAQRLVLKLGAFVFSRCASAVLSASDDISAQVTTMTSGRSRPIVEFLPLYRPEVFASVKPVGKDRLPFRVFYAGRIEVNKGVFDILEIAKRFREINRLDIVFDLCGNGAALASLQEAVKDIGLEQTFRCHGHCRHPEMIRLIGESHVGIVPTRTDFVEGFNQVVVECLLAGRPVVTSSVCPAIHYVDHAVVEVKANDVQAYGDALLRLCDDPQFYEKKHRACAEAQEQFYAEPNSFAAALREVVSAVDQNREPRPRRVPVEVPS